MSGRSARTKQHTFDISDADIAYFLEMIEDDIEWFERDPEDSSSGGAMAHGIARRTREYINGERASYGLSKNQALYILSLLQFDLDEVELTNTEFDQAYKLEHRLKDFIETKDWGSSESRT